MAWHGISWPYIAGFFDGDGSVGPKAGQFRVTLYQSSDQVKVLEEISYFLEAQGMKSYMSHHVGRRAKGESSLQIFGKNAVTMLRKMEPFTIAKFQAVASALSVYGVEPSFQRDIRWSYVAGFFDAEGCISRSKRPQVKLYQNDDLKVLVEISEFLTSKGVVNQLRQYERNYTGRQYLQGFIEINRQRAIKRFLDRVLPHTVVKTNQAEITLSEIETMTAKAKRGELHFNSARAYV